MTTQVVTHLVPLIQIAGQNFVEDVSDLLWRARPAYVLSLRVARSARRFVPKAFVPFAAASLLLLAVAAIHERVREGGAPRQRTHLSGIRVASAGAQPALP